MVPLINSHFRLEWSTKKLGYIYIDESISSRADSLLRITFHVTNVNEYLEVNVYEPNNRKHESKYNVKCKDSSLFLDEKTTSAGSSSSQEVVCEFKRPKLGKWIYEVINSGQQQNVNVYLKAYVFFYFFVDETSYYSNYYDREDFRRRRRRRNILHGDQKENNEFSNFQSSIRVEAKWLKTIVYYPQTQAIYASVSKGLKPILNASVKVYIYRPSGGDVVSLELHDNGLNADRFKNDGIYSRQFSSFNADGLYHGRVRLKKLL